NGQLPFALGHGAGLGHVPRDLGKAVEPPMVVEGVHGSVGPEACPVLAYAPALVVGPPGAGRMSEDALRLASRKVLRRVEDRDVLPDHLAGAVALQPFCTLVPGQDVTIGPDQEDGVVEDRVDEEANRL